MVSASDFSSDDDDDNIIAVVHVDEEQAAPPVDQLYIATYINEDLSCRIAELVYILANRAVVSEFNLTDIQRVFARLVNLPLPVVDALFDARHGCDNCMSPATTLGRCTLCPLMCELCPSCIGGGGNLLCTIHQRFNFEQYGLREFVNHGRLWECIRLILEAAS
jgi:hypothetical protein